MARARKPFCADCGKSDCHVVARPGGGNIWLCGSCEMLRLNPDAELRKHSPGLPAFWRAGRRKQKETLFDDPGR